MNPQHATVSRRTFMQTSVVAIIGAQYGASNAIASGVAQSATRPAVELTSVKALVFDTFGTVVDWRTSVSHEVAELARQKGLNVDAEKFADAWRAGYGPSMNRVRTGELPWTKLDVLHRMILDKILVDFGMKGLSEAETSQLNHAWHRLRPWPDSVSGLTRLKKRFIIAPLSNGNISLMTDLAKFAGLPWDCILGAELARHYKPDPEVYKSAAEFLDLKVGDIMMVAAHLGDLKAAKGVGLKTAFVPRPLELGPQGKPDLKADATVDVSPADFNDLAKQMGV
jgi:2-haloacid dehalogenase